MRTRPQHMSLVLVQPIDHSILMTTLSLLLVIETRDGLLAPVLVEPGQMNLADIRLVLASVVRGSLAHLQYRGGDFDLVGIEDSTPLLDIAKQVGGLWLVTNPRDMEWERVRARELRLLHVNLSHHPVFDLSGLDRPE